MIIPLLGAIALRYGKFILPAICLEVLLPGPVLTAEYPVDYESTDCSKSYTVGNFDIFRLEAKPRNDINIGRDRCYNQFLGVDGLKLKIYIKDVKIGSCGVFLRLFDGDSRMNLEPRWSLGCHTDKQDIHTTYTSELVVRLDKPVSDSTNLYSFTLYVTNEKGPVIDLEEPPKMDGGIGGGVIAGIAVGVGLIIITIIVIVVIVAYRWMKKKDKEHKPYKPQPVFSTASSKSVGEPNGILKRNDSKGRGSKRRDNRSNHENQGYDNKAYRNSVDGDSVTVSGMPDRAHDFDDLERNDRRDGRSSEGTGSVGRRSRRRDYYDRSDAKSASTDNTYNDSVFTNRAYEDDERNYRSAGRDRYREENESWTSGRVSYRTDTTRTRSDSLSRESHGSSTTTDGTLGSYEPRFNKKDNGRVERSRSHSRSSLRSQSERKKRQRNQSADGTDSSSRHHRPHHSQGQHGSHGRRSRSRSREREKKTSPYNDIWVEEKKKRRERRH